MILPWTSPLIATPRPAEQGDDGTDPDGGAVQRPVRVGRAVALHQPEGDADHEGAGGQVGRAGSTCGKVTSWTLLSSTAAKSVSSARPVSGLKRVADRVLHPGVRGQDEVRREQRARGGRATCVAACSAARELVPAEDPQAQEGRLQEERQQPLDGQRGAEHVADEAGVVAPVHPELELLDDAGDHAEREVDQEELAEELGQPQPGLVAACAPRRSRSRRRARRARS